MAQDGGPQPILHLAYAFLEFSISAKHLKYKFLALKALMFHLINSINPFSVKQTQRQKHVLLNFCLNVALYTKQDGPVSL